MDKMNQLKNTMPPADEIAVETAVNNGMQRRMRELRSRNRILKGVTGVLCAAVIVSGATIGINANPAMAAKLAGVPVIGAVVRVLTFDHVKVDTDTMQLNLEIPKIEGVTDKHLEDIINREIQQDADTLLADAKERAKQNEGLPDAMPVMIDSTYQLYHTSDILSFKIDLLETAASAYNTNKFYNIDLRSNERLNLAALFSDGAAYTSRINQAIQSQIADALKADPTCYFAPGEEGAFETISADSKFYISESGNLVIAFDEYEIAPGYAGSPEFVIPHDAISDLLKPEYTSVIR